MLAAPITAQQHEQDITQLDLTTLMNMDVTITSVSKRETRLADAAAAIAIITPDEIRRSGITSIAEALRLVPGVHVARVTANKWAITARGFNGEYASKLLVLVDGRSVYTPNFAGVYWDDQDLMIEDLARIEVIRGPGAALWGANAVNGVINIITRHARDTQGALLSAAYGTEDKPSVGFRYGSANGEDLHYRVYARYFDRDHFTDSTGQDVRDDWRSLRAGFRLDWQSLTVQGDIYSNDVGQFWTNGILNPPSNVDFDLMREHRGGNLLARWTREHSPTSSSSLQIYYDRLRHIDTGSVETRDTGDIDWQHRFRLGTRQDFTWGVSYRVSHDDIPPLPYYFYSSRSTTHSLYTAFAQDDIPLAANRVHLTLGARFEHNAYTGFELQPNVRILWNPALGHTTWAAVARAVRTPVRFDHDARVNAFLLSADDPPVLLAFVNDPDIESETVTAYEFGYRSEPFRSLSIDLATFYNVYRDVLNYDEVEPFFEESPAPPHIVVPLLARNSGHGTTWGAELALQWNARDRWKLNASYSFARMHIRPESVYVSGGDTPEHQFQLRSYLNVTPDLEFTAGAYYTDNLPHQALPSHIRADLGLTWRPVQSLELGLWGHNLLDRRHGEFNSISTAIRTEVPRTFLLRLIWLSPTTP